MRRVLILGAGNAQYDAIRYCKEAGCEVYAISYTDTDKSIPLCDHFEKIDIVDVEAVYEYAQKIDADLIYSVGSDIAMPTAMEVSERLRKPHFVSSETALICNNKNMLRKKLGENFPGNIGYHVVTNKKELEDIDFFPVIMKPVDSQGQRGVMRCDTMGELQKEFDVSMSYSRSKKIIVEQFIEGKEISVNLYMHDGKIIYSLISDRISFSDLPGGIIKEHRVPSQYMDGKTDKLIIDLCDRTVKQLNINEGPVYFQIIVSNQGKPYLIEVTPRFDGCHMWNLIFHYQDVNLLKLAFDYLLYEKEPVIVAKKDDNPMVLHFMCQKPNTMFRKGAFQIEPNHKYLRWYYDEGDNVRVLNGYMEKCGYYID